jgi:transcriptional/translational regulatory protein YebC/TACO1
MAAALEAGGEDLRDEGDEWMVTSAPADLAGIHSALTGASIAVDSAELEMVPTTRVGVTDESTAKRVLKLIELLEEHDDVQSVWANFDIPDEILERVEL